MQKILLFIFLLINFCVLGQVGDLHDGLGYGFKLVEKESGELSKISGSPYLNSDFTRGMLVMDGEDPLPVFIRYDVPDEIMEVKLNEEDSEVYFLPRDENSVYKIGLENFKLMKVPTQEGDVFGYFNVLYDGENVRLLKKYKAELSEPVKARTGYDKDKPAEIEIEKYYYLTLPNTLAKKVETSHRKVERSFDDDKILKYLKQNKIKDEKDLISLAGFIDQNF